MHVIKVTCTLEFIGKASYKTHLRSLLFCKKYLSTLLYAKYREYEPYFSLTSWQCKFKVCTWFLSVLQICVGGDACIHVRIFEGLPVDGGKIELAGVQEGKTLEDAIEYF